ncbi:hypothetical protein D918_00577 [Trichuris suis]|nr:hypothetical protein D918_00577 [Trichuris suis]
MGFFNVHLNGVVGVTDHTFKNSNRNDSLQFRSCSQEQVQLTFYLDSLNLALFRLHSPSAELLELHGNEYLCERLIAMENGAHVFVSITIVDM